MHLVLLPLAGLICPIVGLAAVFDYKFLYYAIDFYIVSLPNAFICIMTLIGNEEQWIYVALGYFCLKIIGCFVTSILIAHIYGPPKRNYKKLVDDTIPYVLTNREFLVEMKEIS